VIHVLGSAKNTVLPCYGLVREIELFDFRAGTTNIFD